jgi:hypothetical protein
MPVPQQNQGGTGILPVADNLEQARCLFHNKIKVEQARCLLLTIWNRQDACCEHKHNIYPDE